MSEGEPLDATPSRRSRNSSRPDRVIVHIFVDKRKIAAGALFGLSCSGVDPGHLHAAVR